MNTKEQILRSLQSKDEELRLQGLREAAHSGAAEEFLPAILDTLGDASWRVRKEAGEVFLSLPAAPKLVGEIIELLHSEENAGLRNAAVEILVRLGRQATPLLLEEMNCSDRDVRKFVLDILGEIGDDSVVPALIHALEDEDANVRSAAAENLGKLACPEAVAPLLKAMNNPDLWFRFTILEALGQLGESVPIESLLRFKEEKLLRKALFDCLGRVCGAGAIPVLIDGLNDEMANVRQSAAVALDRIAADFPREVQVQLTGAVGSQAGEAVSGLLSSTSRDVRKAATRLLGWIGDGRFAPLIIELFEDEMLRATAASALIAMGRSAVCPLMECWEDADSRTRAYLAYVFGESDCVETAGLLRSGIIAADPELRLVSAQSLGKIGSADSLPQLIDCLGDEVEEVRETTIEALCVLGRRHRNAVIEKLRPQLEASDSDRRMSVVLVLGRIGGQEVENCLSFALKDESAQVRQAAVRALEGVAGENQMPALMLALTDEDAEVRRLAAESLGMIEDSQALEPLGLVLQDESIWVRAAAVRALGRLDSPRAVDFVRDALNDPVGLVAIAALETLNGLSAGDAFPLLLQALNHDDEEVINAALQLLAASGRTDWIESRRDTLLNHRHWEVRTTFARTIAGLEGDKCRSCLEERLLIEGEDLVRHQLQDLISGLNGQK